MHFERFLPSRWPACLAADGRVITLMRLCASRAVLPSRWPACLAADGRVITRMHTIASALCGSFLLVGQLGLAADGSVITLVLVIVLFERFLPSRWLALGWQPT